jgi:hypothetical protein
MKYNTQTFIDKAIEVHGNKYDYSKVDYVNSNTKVLIICKEHGEFMQRGSGHLHGKGCSRCGKKDMASKNKRINLEDFLIKSSLHHKDKYDYSLISEINNCHDKLSIKCKNHGIFYQSYSHHIIGQGCPKCGLYRKAVIRNIEEFIEKSNLIHNNKYNYDKVDYKFKKVLIICIIHGEFYQNKSSHLAGNGCRKCGFQKNKNKMTTEQFIEKSKKIHGNNYSYNKVNYIKSSEKVIITCEKHGDFQQTPNGHLNGESCKKCGFDKISSFFVDDFENFIKKAKKLHGDKYDYSNVIYNKSWFKVLIKCNTCLTLFEQTPNKHLYKNRQGGCVRCNNDRTSERMKSNLDEFVSKAILLHGEKYDYSKVVYERSNKGVTIVCKKGHVFIQTPNSHLSGRGCSICNESKLEINMKKYCNYKNIICETQKTYENCKHKAKLRFDNLCIYGTYEFLIELDGAGPHFNSFFYSKIDNKDRFYKDLIKTYYAIHHTPDDLHFIRISYLCDVDTVMDYVLDMIDSGVILPKFLYFPCNPEEVDYEIDNEDFIKIYKTYEIHNKLVNCETYEGFIKIYEEILMLYGYFEPVFEFID